MLKVAVIILAIMLAYGVLCSLMAIIVPKAVMGSFFKAVTGKALDSVQDAGHLEALSILNRAAGLYGLTTAIAGLFILFAAFRKAQKWAWWTLVVVCGIGWLWGLIDHIVIVDKVGILLFAVGMMIFLVGILLPVRVFFANATEEEEETREAHRFFNWALTQFHAAGLAFRREFGNIFFSILLLAVGFLGIWLCKDFLGLESSAILVTLLIAPTVAYAIYSGQLSEIKAGGLKAKFVNTARQSVDLASETIEPSLHEMEIVYKSGASELERQIHRLDESKPIILTLVLGRSYAREVWLRYMEALSQYRNFKFVVILDQESKFVAYIPSWAMLQLLKVEPLFDEIPPGDDFVCSLEQSDTMALHRYPGVVAKTVSTKSTNLDALEQMTAQNLEALIVVDEHRRLQGVVERDQLLSKLILAMVR